MGNSLLLRIGSSIESIEKKLDALAQLLRRGGSVRPELADTFDARRWVENLKRESQEIEKLHDRAKRIS